MSGEVMVDAEIATRALEQIRATKGLITALDQAPAMIRMTSEAKEARKLANESISLHLELMKRLTVDADPVQDPDEDPNQANDPDQDPDEVSHGSEE